MATISFALKSCMKLFRDLIESNRLAQFETEVSGRKWEDELGRLRVWAANIGAHQTGQSSLDYRLRDASHVKTETANLLNSLQETLRGLDDVADTSSDAEPEDEFDQLYEGGLTEVQQIYQSIVDVINYLYRMSMAIRRPARHDQLLETRTIDVTLFIPWAQRHISDKYPGLESELVQRLGAAMARQRAVLKYRERHRAKLGQGVEESEGPQSHGELMSATAATEFIKARDNHDQYLDGMSDSGVSGTSYATTLFASEHGVSIPPPPAESADRAPFECPYCFMIVSIKNRKDWSRHIFRDVMPYTCIYLDCATPSKVFENRRQWYNHLCTRHELVTNPDSCAICPLCNLGIEPPATFERHVGRHLEELALFVLPRIEQEDEAPAHSDETSSGTVEEGNPRPDSVTVDLDINTDPNLPAEQATRLFDLQPAEHQEQEDHVGALGENEPTGSLDKEAAIARLEKLILDGRDQFEAREEHEIRRQADADQTATAVQDGEEDASDEEDAFDEEAAQARKEAEEAAPTAATDAATELPASRKKPIKFKDCVGRKFTFPFELCCTWEGMAELIKQAFLYIEVIGPHVAEGHYDLIDPNGDIIIPQVWDTVIEPGWSITMHMWPMTGKATQGIAPDGPSDTVFPKGVDGEEDILGKE
ncbi:hypothetical protein BJX61DRAFT_547260 [Aspergillus egyptiacus]|nr:hypothetical protein BJX61DRAFT_547260 [Aspergillus egyptiacus]